MPGFRATPLRSSTAPAYSRTRSLPVNLLPSSRRQSTLASIILRKKNEIDIILDGEAEYVHSYSTFDEIKGLVEIKFEADIELEELQITFEGQTLTYVEKIASTAPTTGRTTGRHTFLKLFQPVDTDKLPSDGLLRGGTTYSIPFTFVVPDRLLPYVCSHKVQDDSVRKDHIQLPPTLGDAATSGDGHILMDDLAPAMSRISYGIRARATTRLANGRLVELAEKMERIRVVPGRAEEPPKVIDEEQADYVMRKEKSVRKGLFKIGKIGRLTAETTQPNSLRLPHPSKRTSEPVTTMTTINLRFDPLTLATQPPQLGSLVSKLRAYTFFGAAPYRMIPEVHKNDNWSNLHGIYPESVELSSRNLSTVSWTAHDPNSDPLSPATTNSSTSRRPSTFSITSATFLSPSKTHDPTLPFYTASILVPISLPSHTTKGSSRPKTFVPSFHSCIVSRLYTLELHLSYHTPGSNVSSPSVTLKTPIQISSEGGTPPDGMVEDEEGIVAEIERQFGVYEREQLGESEFEVQSPVYEEEERTPVSRRGTVAYTGGGGGDGGAPPEYNARGAYRVGGGGPRTMSVSING